MLDISLANTRFLEVGGKPEKIDSVIIDMCTIDGLYCWEDGSTQRPGWADSIAIFIANHEGAQETHQYRELEKGNLTKESRIYRGWLEGLLGRSIPRH
ncbi:hypothetical protein DSO57_1024770 [Entomophthora muscae]|uniref:Uncharacterized protein n=1 Tax=Entomophthora muscae TaxID=34485 RepID=A0ACC2TPG4_9FUNG|nr:hypothetical protein DSO57_1024770 [Entomophthora muscae]